MRINYYFLKSIGFFFRILFRNLPDTRCFSLKRSLLRIIGLNVEADVRVCSSAKFMTTGEITLGAGTWIGHEFLLTGGNAEVSIGANCDIAPRVTVVTGTHEILVAKEKIAGPGYSSDVSIGQGCWISTGVIILGGTKIGNCCLVAAGSVVKGQFPDRSLIGGIPARIIRALP